MGGPAALLVLETLLARRWLSLPFGLTAVAAAPLIIAVTCAAIALSVNILSCLTAHYTLDDSTLTIVRGTARWVVPLTTITGVGTGETKAVLVDPLWLPGLWMGRGHVKDRGPAVFVAAVPPVQAVAVYTEACTYLLSPKQAPRFAAALEESRSRAGAAVEGMDGAREPSAGYLGALLQPLPAALALLAAAANWALYVQIIRWTPAMPAQMPVHFTALGAADRWGPPTALLWLAQIGTVIVAMNLLVALLPPLRRSAPPALLMGTALLVQILLWLAFAALLP
jgi:hypothetical protein